jgi:hypothetical protein
MLPITPRTCAVDDRKCFSFLTLVLPGIDLALVVAAVQVKKRLGARRPHLHCCRLVLGRPQLSRATQPFAAKFSSITARVQIEVPQLTTDAELTSWLSLSSRRTRARRSLGQLSRSLRRLQSAHQRKKMDVRAEIKTGIYQSLAY